MPWRAALTNRNIWLLGTIISCAAATSYLYYSWYPKYLQAARDVGLIESGWLVALVLAGGVAGMLGGGIVADHVVRRGADRSCARRRLGSRAFVVAAVLLLAGTACDSPLASTILAAGSCLAMSCQQSVWWSSASEIGGRNLGALFGLLNMMGMPGAMASQFFFALGGLEAVARFLRPRSVGSRLLRLRRAAVGWRRVLAVRGHVTPDRRGGESRGG